MIHRPQSRVLDPGVRAAVVYVIVALSSSVLASWIGSLSEYRFPHPLLATTLHLSIAFATLLGLALSARAALAAQSGRSSRQLTNPSTSLRASSTAAAILQALAAQLPSSVPAAVSALTNPRALASGMLALLAALMELHAAPVSTASFWAGARALTLALSVAAAALVQRHSATSSPLTGSLSAIVACAMLLGGPSTAFIPDGSGRASVGAIGWALCVVAWAWQIQTHGKGQLRDDSSSEKHEPHFHEDGKDSLVHEEPSLRLLAHLAVSITLMSIPLFLSTELRDAAESRHYGFFTEPGFWVQETILALCGLANLAAWWQLVSNLSLPRAFSIIALKDFLLPYVFHYAMGNPLPPFSSLGRIEPTQIPTAFTAKQQWIALILYSGWKVAELLPAGPVIYRRKAG